MSKSTALVKYQRHLPATTRVSGGTVAISLVLLALLILWLMRIQEIWYEPWSYGDIQVRV